MSKYYLLLFLAVGIVLYFIFLEDPCSSKFRTDFSSQYPDYEILKVGAGEGSPESVQCHISYIKPDDERIYEDIWLYLNADSGWNFSRIIKTDTPD